VEEIYDLASERLVDPVDLSPSKHHRSQQQEEEKEGKSQSSEENDQKRKKSNSGVLGFIFLFKWIEERRYLLKNVYRKYVKTFKFN